jgi:EAL domain-containing protein (putative c-di-GMP-specific phosphodiesterase class I)
MDLLINSGLIIDAGEWMIKTLFEQINDWRVQGSWHSRLPIMEKQLRNSRLSEILIREIELNKMSSERIIMTISEAAAVKNTLIIK